MFAGDELFGDEITSGGPIDGDLRFDGTAEDDVPSCQRCGGELEDLADALCPGCAEDDEWELQQQEADPAERCPPRE